jgi:hypothetical protein
MHFVARQLSNRQMCRPYGLGIPSLTFILSGVITLQVQLAEIKNKMSEYVRTDQNASTFGITVRGVPVARPAWPLPDPSSGESSKSSLFVHAFVTAVGNGAAAGGRGEPSRRLCRASLS